MSRHLVGVAYTNVPANAKGVPAVFHPTDEVGGSSEDIGVSIVADAKLMVIYGVIVTKAGAFLISLANGGTLITNFNASVPGEIMFGEQGIEVRGSLRISVPASSTANVTVLWKRIV